MARKIHHFKGFSFVDGDIKVNVNMDRFSEQFNRAQYQLDGMVMTSMVPYMPHNTGTFVNLTRSQSAALQGTGEVMAAAAPMGRFLYIGKTMVDEKTGSPWARKGAKKVLVSQYGGHTGSKEDLAYSNPKAVPFWFDKAKEVDGKKWIKRVKAVAGGG